MPGVVSGKQPWTGLPPFLPLALVFLSDLYTSPLWHLNIISHNKMPTISTSFSILTSLPKTAPIQSLYALLFTKDCHSLSIFRLCSSQELSPLVLWRTLLNLMPRFQFFTSFFIFLQSQLSYGAQIFPPSHNIFDQLLSCPLSRGSTTAYFADGDWKSVF